EPLVPPLREMILPSPRGGTYARATTHLLDLMLGSSSGSELPATLRLERAILRQPLLESVEATDRHSVLLESLAREVRSVDATLAGIGFAAAGDVLETIQGANAREGGGALAARELALDDEAWALFATPTRPDDPAVFDNQRRFRLERARDIRYALYLRGAEAEKKQRALEVLRLSVESIEAPGEGAVRAAAASAFRYHLELGASEEATRAVLARHRALIASHFIYPEVVRVVEHDPAKALELARERRLTTASLELATVIGVEANALIDLGRFDEARALIPELEKFGPSPDLPLPLDRLKLAGIQERLRNEARPVQDGPR
ncbi:MAG: hypothetical protein ACAI25_12410, partial [Planctomycetota bacterium]